VVEKINRILVILIVAGVCSYWYYLNPAPITLRYSNTGELTAPLAVLFLGAFALGIVCMMILALYFGTKSYFRERNLISREKRHIQFYEQLLEARGAQAVNDRGLAQSRWEAISRKHPTNVIARIELAKTVRDGGDSNAALQILDEARAHSNNNPEVLLLAAEINGAVGNLTSALDNTKLLFQTCPTLKVAQMARDFARKLGRYEEALSFHETVSQFSSTPADQELENELHFERAVAENLQLGGSAEESESRLAPVLEKLIKRHPSAAAFKKLAELEVARGDEEYAATLLGKAAQLSGDIRIVSEAVHRALAASGPERAIAMQRMFVDKLQGTNKVGARIMLVELFLRMHMNTEARRELDGLRELISEMPHNEAHKFMEPMVRLSGLCALVEGDSARAAKILREQLSSSGLELPSASAGALPDPALSTP
jgi:tetratricopeptide (TPR) repeat protein